MKIFTFLLGLFIFSSAAHAEKFQCRADFDESSHYELSAETESGSIRGSVVFRYVTEDGIDLSAELSPKEQKFESEKFFRVMAENQNMRVLAEGIFDRTQEKFSGNIRVNFDLEHADPVELAAICTLN
jgi:hypothetical protein